MHRFFITERDLKNDVALLSPEDTRHARDVLRLDAGDHIVLVIPDGPQYVAQITLVGPSRMAAQILREQTCAPEPPVKITLYQGIPKGDKMDMAVQKCTELGIHKIVPVFCRRTVIRWDETKCRERQQRWQRIAKEAARQSRRGSYPQVAFPVEFERTVTGLDVTLADKETLGLVPWEQERRHGVKQILKSHKHVKNILLWIGPEGGLDPSEVAMVTRAGGLPVSLGPRILRSETAGLVVVAILLYEFGDLGEGYME
ncbi:MAG TPA: 16S rRNA (uracil(1498)-N(3))-methyltransferase [Clostridia bacterium]|nr:16S rRNA (uracil(1498)-N(3))-methyltransferase [Clostridia bacterium]